VIQRGIVAVLAGWVLAGTAYGSEADPLAIEIQPREAEIGLFYGGVDLAVSGEVEPDTQLAILVSGPPVDLHFSKKEKVWGLFWAPRKDVTFEGVAGLYHLVTSGELDELAPEEVLIELGLGYESLRPGHKDTDSEVDPFLELVRLKESEGLFLVKKAGEENPSETGSHPFRVSFHVPANAPPTTYSVEVFVFRDGRLLTSGERSFVLRQTRFISFITSLAREYGLLYGILAVVVALAAGLGVGFLYGSAKGH
jgi:uncharacterized protein (TIGR02186 family)